MIILQDSREQIPLHFDDPIVTEVEITCLPVGDYGCIYRNGWECPIVFERKNLFDLYGTLSQGYDRFKREIERATEQGYKLILIIEGTMRDVYNGIPHSKRDGQSLMKQIFTLWTKYDVLPVFCKDRAEMARFIVETYTALGRKALEDLKTNRKTTPKPEPTKDIADKVSHT